MEELARRILELSQPLKPEPTTISARLASLPGIRAVLFDVYGTLFISGSGDVGTAGKTDRITAFSEAFAALGIQAQCRSRKLARRGTDLVMEAIEHFHRLRRSQGVDYPEVDILEIWRDVYVKLQQENLIEAPVVVSNEFLMKLAVDYECRINPVWPMPGLKRVLAYLVSRGMNLGIVSNAQFYTPLLFSAFLEDNHAEIGFCDTFCAWSYQSLEAKPSIHLFEHALDSLEREAGIKPSETLYLGNDLLNDIWPAAELGMKTALFAGDRRSLRLRENDARCAHVQPDLVITELMQLVRCI